MKPPPPTASFIIASDDAKLVIFPEVEPDYVYFKWTGTIEHLTIAAAPRRSGYIYTSVFKDNDHLIIISCLVFVSRCKSVTCPGCVSSQFNRLAVVPGNSNLTPRYLKG